MSTASDTLQLDVDAARAGVRLYLYPVPPTIGRQFLCTGCKNRETHKIKHLDLESALWRSLPTSTHTNDPEGADFFVVQHAMYSRSLGRGPLPRILTDYFDNGFSPYLHYIRHGLPYFNRSEGRDHLYVWVGDMGVKCDCYGLDKILSVRPMESYMLHQMMRVGYQGSTDPHIGWRNGYDISMPMWNMFHTRNRSAPWQTLVRAAAKRSNMHAKFSPWGDATKCASHDFACGCSAGFRRWLYYNYTASACGDWTRRCTNVSVAHAWYALCPAGWGCWSSRLFDAIDKLAVPVILANGALQPFERFLDWRAFSVQLDTEVLSGMEAAPQPPPGYTCKAQYPWDGTCLIKSAPIMVGKDPRGANASGLDALHMEAARIAPACSGSDSGSSPDDAPPTACAELPTVRMVRELQAVRRWFAWNASDPYSAFGLLLLELRCRMHHLGRIRGSHARGHPHEAGQNGRHNRTRLLPSCVLEQPLLPTAISIDGAASAS